VQPRVEVAPEHAPHGALQPVTAAPQHQPEHEPQDAAHHHDGEHHHEPASEEAVDPVCGMHVAPANATEHRDSDHHTIYFCSISCAATFDADPDRYLSPVRRTPDAR
jgi:P-type Cu+ transporter